MFYDYIDTGSYSGITYASNEKDFNKIKLKQRVGVNIKNRDLSTYILGKKVQSSFRLFSSWYGRNDVS